MQKSLRTVFLIMMENHNWSDIKQNSSAPYINQTLLPMASYAEEFYNPPGIHPSEPNYLWLEAGTNFGVTNDDEPSANRYLARSSWYLMEVVPGRYRWNCLSHPKQRLVCYQA
jgi:hypothetical protein